MIQIDVQKFLTELEGVGVDEDQRDAIVFALVASAHKAFDPVGDVQRFMEACGQSVRDSPTPATYAEVSLRISLIKEEFKEFQEACHHYKHALHADNEHLAEVAFADILDAVVDIVYVTVGAAHTFGLPFYDGWEEVQKSNMSKIDPETGSVPRREDGKVLKGPHFVEPDFRKIVKEAK